MIETNVENILSNVSYVYFSQGLLVPDTLHIQGNTPTLTVSIKNALDAIGIEYRHNVVEGPNEAYYKGYFEMSKSEMEKLVEMLPDLKNKWKVK